MMGVWTPDKTGVLWSYPYYPATITGENPTNVMLQWWRGAIFFSWSIDYRQTEIYSPACQHAVAPPLGASIPPIPTFERRRKGAHVSLSVSKGPIFTDKMVIKQWGTWCCLTTIGHHVFFGPHILRRNRVMISEMNLRCWICWHQLFLWANVLPFLHGRPHQEFTGLRGTIPCANLSDLGTRKICADRLVLYGSQSRTMTVRYVWIRLSHCLWYCHFWLYKIICVDPVVCIWWFVDKTYLG